ncbi:MAG: 2-oxoacid:acceptor oxidoreductase subunit alpha [Deltaproteobacteria bacterium]|nr:2-oxoacid:acceptor oxidoreductase subunit alpha [Deltaproteobacteria bacterium]
MTSTEQVAGGERIHTRETMDEVVIRFAGDSGDGMQLTGGQFTSTSALLGNDLATFPDYPAEIRAPAGTIPGVSAFQVRIANYDIHTPGDAPDVLVAMNPAALKKSLADLRPNGIIIANTDEFNARNLQKAGYEANPLEDGSLEGYRVHTADITTMTRRALEGSGLDTKSMDRCKNFFALGMVYWIFSRPLETSVDWLREKFASKPTLAEANEKVLHAGYNFCDITQAFQVRYEIAPAALGEGTYRNIMGNSALAIGLVAASHQIGRPLYLGSYPITPASDILHELSGYKRHGVITFQAEDEIAAIAATIGAAYAGHLAVTTTSGPGLALKSEALNLAVMVELPLVVVNVQRGGPSTGLPTKTEQSDLLQALFGRNGDSPVPVIAASSPADAFDTAMEACRIAVESMAPVLLLSDGYIANGSEPWRLPDLKSLPRPRVESPTEPEGFQPYARNEEHLARPWAIPGVPGLEHRVGGLEKDKLTGNVSYDPKNHDEMTRLRAAKVAKIADHIPELEVVGEPSGDLLVLGWGSTLGAITGAVRKAQEKGLKVSRAHLRYLNPFPKNLGEVLGRFDKILIPEMNDGQLAFVIQAKFRREVVSFSKVEGMPFYRDELLQRIEAALEAKSND